jgi:aminopeptidase N
MSVVLQSSKDVVNQWFSQLISPASWKYMWLTEGLTEYMKYYTADKVNYFSLLNLFGFVTWYIIQL